LKDFGKYAGLQLIKMGLLWLQQKPRCEKMFWTTGKGDRQWETRAVRKIRKRVRNRIPKNRNKNQKTSLISSQKENLDRNHGAEICTTAFPV
jgi:hypothetical protein